MIESFGVRIGWLLAMALGLAGVGGCSSAASDGAGDSSGDAPGGADEEVGQEELAATALCTGTEDFKTDPANCGRCGHDCLGGACTAGVCQPVELAPATSGGAWDVSVDGAYVYWRTPQSVQILSKTGGPARTLVTTSGETPRSRGRVVTTAAHVYTIDGSTILRVSRTPGSKPVAMAAGEDDPVSLATDGTNLYWGTATAVRRVPLTGGAPVDVVKSSYRSSVVRPFDLSVDSTTVWWGERSWYQDRTYLYDAPKDATSATPHYRRTTTALEIRADADTLYTLSGSPSPSIWGLRKSWGEEFEIVPRLAAHPDHFVVDGAFLTLIDQPANAVMRVRKTGGPLRRLATVPTPTDVAADRRAVYVTTASGAVFMVAK